jgi:hypothetical protein
MLPGKGVDAPDLATVKDFRFHAALGRGRGLIVKEKAVANVRRPKHDFTLRDLNRLLVTL